MRLMNLFRVLLFLLAETTLSLTAASTLGFSDTESVAIEEWSSHQGTDSLKMFIVDILSLIHFKKRKCQRQMQNNQ